MEKNIQIKCVLLDSDMGLPTYESKEAACCDLRACCKADIEILPMQRAVIPTGLKLQLPTGYEAQLRPRSGLALKYGITVLNSPGTIDSDFRGEIKVILINLGSKAFVVHKGDRVAQLFFNTVTKADFLPVLELDSSERDCKGFGSTGL